VFVVRIRTELYLPFCGQIGRWQFLVNKGQVDSFGGQRGRLTVLVDTEEGGQFWWTMRQVASFGGQ
jgi:hypothetical protein